MKRTPWPRDDSPRRKGERRVRLWAVVLGSRVLSIHVTRGDAEHVALVAAAPPNPMNVRIRRAVASLRWVDA